MKKKNKNLLIKAFSILGDSTGIVEKDRMIKALIQEDELFGKSEKFALYKHFKQLIRIDDRKYWMLDATIGSTVKLMNQLERHQVRRTKEEKLKQGLKDNRDQTVPIIFYLSSWHDHCADGHQDYEGKIYVDKYWKSTMEKHPELLWMIPGITAYIRNHKVQTIQGITHGEPYLVTRPHCKHFFIPIDNFTVLTSSLNAIKRENPQGFKKSAKKTPGQYRLEYYQLREAIRKRLESI